MARDEAKEGARGRSQRIQGTMLRSRDMTLHATGNQRRALSGEGPGSDFKLRHTILARSRRTDTHLPTVAIDHEIRVASLSRSSGHRDRQERMD